MCVTRDMGGIFHETITGFGLSDVVVVHVVVLHVPRSSGWLTPVGGAHAV